MNLESWHKFVTLRIGMKKLGTKIFAALLVLWYLTGIIGFGMHTCNGSGRSFVVAFFEEMTCEDIHPEHSCGCGHDHAACCMAGNDGRCQHCDAVAFSARSCCSDDYIALDFSGILSEDNHRHYDECSCGSCPCIPLHSSGITVNSEYLANTEYIPQSDTGVFMACDRQAVFSVWRI